MRILPGFVMLVASVVSLPVFAGNLYAVCEACHGKNGEGNKALNAPRIAGLPAWYVERQLNNFKAGIRGADARDIYGTQMRPMAMTLADDKAVAAVASQIESMQAPAAPTEIEGNLENGKTLYQTCMACHGADGQGNAALNAPPLAGQSDWYLVRQLNAYKTGLRGTHKDDTYGQQMRPMAMTLASDDAVRDVTVYIKSLSE